jgi:hypothetical protein
MDMFTCGGSILCASDVDDRFTQKRRRCRHLVNVAPAEHAVNGP